MMKTIRNGNVEGSGNRTCRSPASRPRVRRDPLCEVLEGRQLLSTTAGAVSSGVPGWGSWHGSWSGSTTAETAHFSGAGKHGAHGAWAADFTHSGDSGSSTPKTWTPGDEAAFHHAAK